MHFRGRNNGGDQLEEFAGGSLISKIFVGGVVPLGLVAWGVYAIVTQYTFIPSKGRTRWEFIGANAIFFGIAAIGFACFPHLKYVWEFSPRLWGVAEVLEHIALAVTAVALVLAMVL